MGYSIKQLKWFWKNKLKKRYKDIDFLYDTSSLLAKKRFYPRYISQFHEEAIMDIIYSHRDDEGTFIDIGANVGYFTIFGSQLFKNTISCEMNPDLINVINASLKLNRKGGKNDIYCGSVRDKSGYFFTYKTHGDKDAHATNKVHTDGGGIMIQSIALDDLKLKQTVNLIKIDVEGAEYKALLGMKELLKTRPAIVMEVHPSLLMSYGKHNVNDIFLLLSEIGYNNFYYLDHRMKNEQLLEITEFDNFLKDNFVLYVY